MTLGPRKLVIAGIIVFAIGIITKFPARVAAHFVPEAVSISGLSGTIWNGRAGAVLVSGIYLRNVEWQARPLALFTGKLALSIKASPVSGFIESDLAVGFGGAVSLSDLNASMPLSVLADAVQVPGLGGSASLAFDNLSLRDGVPDSATGTLNIANLNVPTVHSNSLGGYSLEFVDLDDDVVASIEDTDGVIDIAGMLTVSGDRSYSLLAQLAAKPETPSDLARQLAFLPDGNAEGQHELRLEGSL